MGLTGGNMEGKEVRFGIVASALFAVITTAASCGAVNAMHDSFTALGGMIPLINMQLGEIIVGGVGAGMYGMLLFVILAIFVAGLMVGRTPEYVGKKIEAKEVKMAMLAILILPLMYLGWTAVAVVYPPAVASMANPGPARLLAKCSMPTRRRPATTARRSRASPATRSSTTSTGAHRDAGRPLLDDHPGDGDRRLAGGQEDRCRLRPARSRPPAACSSACVVGVILIIGGLTFFPALALGPIVEHLAMIAGTTFSIELIRSHFHGNLNYPQAHAGLGAVRSQDRACRRSARPSSSSTRGR